MTGKISGSPEEMPFQEEMVIARPSEAVLSWRSMSTSSHGYPHNFRSHLTDKED